MIFLSSRLRRWAVLAVAVPLAGRGLQMVAARLTARKGPTPAAARLDQVGALLRSRRRR